MAEFSRHQGTDGIRLLRIELLRFQRGNMSSFWSRVMDLCVFESTQMKGFIAQITSVVNSSAVHRDMACHPKGVRFRQARGPYATDCGAAASPFF